MRFSVNKVLALLLPLIQMASGGAVGDMSRTLPSLRLVGSFSVGIEGLPAPLTFSHNLELPLTTLGQRLLDWTERNTAEAAPPRISSPAENNSSGGGRSALMSLDDAHFPDQQQDDDEYADEKPDESRLKAKEGSEDNGLQLVLKQPDTRATNLLSTETSSRKKRKAAKLGLDYEGRATSKRTKVEEDRAAPQQLKLGSKHRRERKISQGAKRCKHCRHCRRQD